jgi:hypothetical protein
MGDFEEVDVTEVWHNPKTGELVICGIPSEEEDEDNPKHSCDEMGCSSVRHILFRGRVTKWLEQ